MEVFKVRDLGVNLGGKPVLQNLSLTIRRGEFIGLLGPNGSGKTTLLRSLAGVLTPSYGEIFFQGREIRTYGRHALAQKIAVLPQEQWIDFPFSAFEVAMMGRAPFLKPFQWEGAKDIEITLKAMQQTDCQHLAEQDIRTLSGGERERVLLARALAQTPEVLLLDEPTTHVDLRHQAELLRLLKRLQREQGLTLVVVLHDLNFASLACDRLLILGNHGLAAEGTPGEVLSAERIQALFGVAVRGGMVSDTGRPFFVPDLKE